MSNDTSSIPLRRCSKCKGDFPPTIEFFEFRKERQALHSWCRLCRAASKRSRRKNPETRAIQLIQDKKYHRKQRSTPEGRERINEYKRTVYRTNEQYANHCRIKSSEYAQLPSVQSHKQAYIKKYNASPVGKIKKKISKSRRRTRLLELPDTLTNTQWEQCLTYFNNKCAVCGRSPDMWTNLNLDHWIALNDKRQDNPGNVAINVVPLCGHSNGGVRLTGYCNLSKRDKDPSKWLIERFGKGKAKKILKRIEDYFAWVRVNND